MPPDQSTLQTSASESVLMGNRRSGRFGDGVAFAARKGRRRPKRQRGGRQPTRSLHRNTERSRTVGRVLSILFRLQICRFDPRSGAPRADVRKPPHRLAQRGRVLTWRCMRMNPPSIGNSLGSPRRCSRKARKRTGSSSCRMATGFVLLGARPWNASSFHSRTRCQGPQRQFRLNSKSLARNARYRSTFIAALQTPARAAGG